MTIVEATVTLGINQNHTSFEELEAQIQEQVMEDGKDLLPGAMQAVSPQGIKQGCHNRAALFDIFDY